MNEDIVTYMDNMGRQARLASTALSCAETGVKNNALMAIADALDGAAAGLQAENAKDLEAGRANGLSQALLDRLDLTEQRIANMSEGLRQIVALADPVGVVSDLAYRPSGLQIGKMRVPLGVIGIIYESRPNVTADAAGLCIKSGNAVILRGGSEAIHSNKAIAQCIQQGLVAAGLPASVVQLVATTDRAAVGEMLAAKELIDVIIPRGGKRLIERVSNESKVPVIKHLDGICHVYIDDKADKDKSIGVAFNAKTQRYGVCNALETLLINAAIARQVLPDLALLYQHEGVELRGCPRSRDIVNTLQAATDEDWETEYLAPILSIRIVDTLDEAIDHINTHGSHHTDAIMTEDYAKARRFLREVDSSSVMVNASTRFADGFEYGLGAEIGISTDKLHVRGPVGLEGLTTQKYIVLGDGHIVA